MPIYEYQCRACGADFEKIVRSSNQRVECPACGARDVQRTPSTFGIGGTGKSASVSGGGGCAGCSGGACATCH